MNKIYVKTLKRVENTVFSVAEGQKKYYDPIFGKYVAYSSGQQVKKCLIDKMLEEMGKVEATVTFYESINKKGQIENRQIESLSDPRYADQLIRGYMYASTNGTIKRRSPLSISHMTPLHPQLASVFSENITFDRSKSTGKHQVKVLDVQGNEMKEEDVNSFLEENNRTLPLKHWIPENYRTSGLYKQFLQIDLRTLFTVSINANEPEIKKSLHAELIADGWQKGKNEFGEIFLVPDEMIREVIPALVKGILCWQITTNQATTFSGMPTLAVAIGGDAHKTEMAIRSKMKNETEAAAVVGPVAGVDLFITPFCEEILPVQGDEEALKKAEGKLVDLITQYYFK